MNRARHCDGGTIRVAAFLTLALNPFSLAGSFLSDALRPGLGDVVPEDPRYTTLRTQWVYQTPMPIDLGSPTLANVLGDANQEVIVGDMAGYLHVLTVRANPPSVASAGGRWPAHLVFNGLPQPIDTTPAVGNIDNDPELEIVV
jgi:hypothetical protein